MSSNSVIIDALKEHGVRDEVTKVDFVPAGKLNVHYEKSNVDAELGNELLAVDTQEKPIVTFELNEGVEYKDSDLFTLVVTDPDAPLRSYPILSEICHYAEVDIKLNGKKTELKDGKVLMPYIGPGPPPKADPHRYVFLLYKQLEEYTSDKFSEIKSKIKWGYETKSTGAQKWTEENKMELVAANFFVARATSNSLFDIAGWIYQRLTE